MVRTDACPEVAAIFGPQGPFHLVVERVEFAPIPPFSIFQHVFVYSYAIVRSRAGRDVVLPRLGFRDISHRLVLMSTVRWLGELLVLVSGVVGQTSVPGYDFLLPVFPILHGSRVLLEHLFFSAFADGLLWAVVGVEKPVSGQEKLPGVFQVLVLDGFGGSARPAAGASPPSDSAAGVISPPGVGLGRLDQFRVEFVYFAGSGERDGLVVGRHRDDQRRQSGDLQVVEGRGQPPLGVLVDRHDLEPEPELFDGGGGSLDPSEQGEDLIRPLSLRLHEHEMPLGHRIMMRTI